MQAPPCSGSPLAEHFALDPDLVFLNHGSFGACPRTVLETQQALRLQLEREPISFLVRELEGRMDKAREVVADFVGADTSDLVSVPNATSGVNAVLRSMSLAPGDLLLTTDQAYNACANALHFVAERAGASVRIIKLPHPCPSPQAVQAAIDEGLDSLDGRCRLLLLDHVTSPTGLVLPLEILVPAVEARGVPVLVDGAHAPGMIELDLRSLGASYYTGNLHKWCCAPKGAAFLWVKPALQDSVRPVVISHGANAPARADRSRFHQEFDWVGTGDPTAFLAAAHAIETLPGLLPGGWPAIRAHNHQLALMARSLLCERLGAEPLCPEEMVGSLAAVAIPDRPSGAPDPVGYIPALQERLFRHHAIEVPVIPWPALPSRLVRVSAQLYNSLEQVELLANALPEALAWERSAISCASA